MQLGIERYLTFHVTANAGHEKHSWDLWLNTNVDILINTQKRLTYASVLWGKRIEKENTEAMVKTISSYLSGPVCDDNKSQTFKPKVSASMQIMTILSNLTLEDTKS